MILDFSACFDKFRQSRFGRKFLDILYETTVLVAYIGAIALIHVVEEKWIGKDALFFGRTKIGYIIDVGHLLAIGLFFLEIVKDVFEVLRDIVDIVIKSFVQALRRFDEVIQEASESINMSNPINDEFERFRKLLSNYGKVIVAGMLLSGIFLFLYAGIRANYVSIAVLTAVVSTLSLSLVILLLYVRFHEKRWEPQSDKRSLLEAIRESDRSDDEELRKMIADAIATLPSTQTTSPKSTLLFSVFRWGHLTGKMFYYGLTLVKLESGFRKGPREVSH